MNQTVYGIRNTTGVLMAEHIRVDGPDGSKRMFWRLPDGDARDGLSGLPTADLPLYNSQIIPSLYAGETVVVTEGERACDTLVSLGIPALSTVTGASGTPGEHALSVLLPFDVVLWPDNDKPGQAHMERVAASIIRLGGCARRLAWGSVKGDDAVDCVANRGADARTLVELLIRAAEPWRLQDAPVPSSPARPSYERHDDTRVQVARSHLLDVVEARLGPPKRRMGRSLFWPCPFHAGDRDPSFKVDTKEPFYRCFGCEARGDVFTFLRAIEGREFKDALSDLAPAVGLGGIPRLGA